MKSLFPALLLALGACGSLSTGEPAGGGGPVATSSVSGQTTASQQAATLRAQGVTDNPGTNDLAGSRAARPITLDASQKFEYADVYTTLGDPTGMRELVPYLLKPEVWTLIKCEMLSDTSKHYRFQRISTGTGRVMPDVDVFKTRK